jgi:hypothetical protein
MLPVPVELDAGDDDDPQVRPHLRRNTAPPAGYLLLHRILTLVGFPAWVGGWRAGWPLAAPALVVERRTTRETRYGPKARRLLPTLGCVGW